MRKIQPLLFAALLALAGCGLHPVYGTVNDSGGNKVAGELNDIAIANIPDRNGQMLRNDLIDRLYGPNRPAQPRYTLTVKVHPSIEYLGILANATSTRALLNMYGDYVLTGPGGVEVLHGTAHSVASFDQLDQMYGTVAAQANAEENTLHEVSEQIVNRLSLYFSERR